MGGYAWTNHIYFQITQPGSSTLTPLYLPIVCCNLQGPDQGACAERGRVHRRGDDEQDVHGPGDRHRAGPCRPDHSTGITPCRVILFFG